METIETYFFQQDMSIYLPAGGVSIKSTSENMRMVLIAMGKSEPYKVFYRYESDDVEIF